MGSGTTGIAANLVGRLFVGIDSERSYLDMAVRRRLELERVRSEWSKKIADLRILDE